MSRLHRITQPASLPHRLRRVAGSLALVLVTAASAVVAKELSARSESSALAAVAPVQHSPLVVNKTPLVIVDPLAGAGTMDTDMLWSPAAAAVPVFLASSSDLKVRWFNGRAVRPARTIT